MHHAAWGLVLAGSSAFAGEPVFPSSWVGTWRGDARVVGGSRDLAFTHELKVAPTNDPGRFAWTIVYDGPMGRQVREYTLLVKDAAKGEYAIDENQGIVLPVRLIDGALYSQFEVMGNRITSRERLVSPPGGEPYVEVEMATTRVENPEVSGGKEGVPEVKSFGVASVQKGVLKRVTQVNAPAEQARPTLGPWTKLTTVRYPGKQDDIHFIDRERGWYANGAGKLYRTSDAGQTWTLAHDKPGTFFRCLAFLDESAGFVGNIGTEYFPNVSDETPLYRTRDAGVTLEPVTIAGDPVKGLCALEVVRWDFINAGRLDKKRLIVGGGRVGGPAVFIKSTDDGQTWNATDIRPFGAMVLDVHFFDDKVGIIASASDANVAQSNALILRTEDGGQHWAKVYQSARPYELTWKISFPSRDVGYVTIQSYNPDKAASKRFVAKTTDNGRTWSEIDLVDDHNVRQFGVAFVDNDRGWVGAAPGGFETLDGGKTWARVNMGNAVNKIRVLKTDQGFTAYAIGTEVHRIDGK